MYSNPNTSYGAHGFGLTPGFTTTPSRNAIAPRRDNIIPTYDVKDSPNDLMTLMLATVVEHNSSLYVLSEAGNAIAVHAASELRSHKWYPPDVEGRRIELLKRRVGIQNWSNWSESLRNCPQFPPEFWYLLQREMDQSTQRSVTGSIELRESDLETFKISWKDHDPKSFNEFTHACVELARTLHSGPQVRSCLQAGLTAGVGMASLGQETQMSRGGLSGVDGTTGPLQTPGLRKPLTGFGATPFAKPTAPKPSPAVGGSGAAEDISRITPWSTRRAPLQPPAPELDREDELSQNPLSQSDEPDESDVPIPTGSMLGRPMSRGYRASGFGASNATAPGTGSVLGRALFKTPAAPEGGRTQSRLGLLNSGARGSMGGALTTLPETPRNIPGTLIPAEPDAHADQDLGQLTAQLTQTSGTVVVAPESVESMLFPKQIRPAERVLGTGVDPIAKWKQAPMEHPNRVTVFGYAPSQAGQVLERLSAFGDVVRRVDGPTGQWMCITFASPQSTFRVLGTDGYFKLSDGTLVGVQPFMNEHLTQDTVATLNASNQSNVESVVRRRAANSAHIFAQPTLVERGVPRQNTCEKIMRFIFNW